MLSLGEASCGVLGCNTILFGRWLFSAGPIGGDNEANDTTTRFWLESYSSWKSPDKYLGIWKLEWHETMNDGKNTNGVKEIVDEAYFETKQMVGFRSDSHASIKRAILQHLLGLGSVAGA